MGVRLLKVENMTKAEIQKELDNIASARFALKSDKQLCYYELLKLRCIEKYKGKQPGALVKFNSNKHRNTKLSMEQVEEIRRLYKRGKFGKKRLAKEFSVSSTMIHKIITGQKWRYN